MSKEILTDSHNSIPILLEASKDAPEHFRAIAKMIGNYDYKEYKKEARNKNHLENSKKKKVVNNNTALKKLYLF